MSISKKKKMGSFRVPRIFSGSRLPRVARVSRLKWYSPPPRVTACGSSMARRSARLRGARTTPSLIRAIYKPNQRVSTDSSVMRGREVIGRRAGTP
jgi:hypothetical protein